MRIHINGLHCTLKFYVTAQEAQYPFLEANSFMFPGMIVHIKSCLKSGVRFERVNQQQAHSAGGPQPTQHK